MKYRGAIATTILLSGCMIPQSLGARGALILKPQITDGKYLSQTVIPAYTQASINHLILKLYTYDGAEHDQGIQKSILNAQLDNPITFSNLKANTTYRIKALAYASTDESALISTTDANSYTDVTLINDDRPALAPLKVKLIDIAFNGQATSSLAITPGGYSLGGPEYLYAPPVGIVSTFAGNGIASYAEGSGTSISFNTPFGVAVDSSGNVYISDRENQRIRKIPPNGQIVTLAGNGAVGCSDGTGTAATFNYPRGLAVDSSGFVYVADRNNNLLRKISPAGVVTTLAGSGIATMSEGLGTLASFNYPSALAVDAAGNIFLADDGNNRVCKITPAGLVSTFAGNGSSALIDGTGTSAFLGSPRSVALDTAGNLYVPEYNNHCIRKISPTGVVTTLAGNGTSGTADGQGSNATFYRPYGVAVDLFGNVYVADTANNRIRKVTPGGLVTTLAGNSGNFADGIGTLAGFNTPTSLAFGLTGNLYVADPYNHRIRLIQ